MAAGGSGSEKAYCFSSESVSAGHPDKVCDCISDAVLDACLEVDPNAKVACETATKTGMVMVFGEITVKGKIDYEAIVRNTLKDIGYDDAEHSIDYRTCNVVVAIEEQSPDIAGGVHEGRSEEDTGAGDQGLMFGYATNETEEGMPMTHMLAHKLARELTEQRKSGAIPWLRPDNKTQITMEVKEVDGKIVPQRVHTVVISAQHSEDVDNETIRAELTEKVVKKVVPADLLDDATRMIINPSGRFVIGGPYGDAGLTGRKIIVDTYGGWGAHGGGAFSGKDPTKVDRSAAYGARWAALSLVKAGLCERALVQLSYAIGIAEPLNIYVNTYGTVKDGRTDEDLVEILKKNFSFTPFALARDLKLKRPQYARTAAGGHFGRPGEGFEWEKPKELTL